MQSAAYFAAGLAITIGILRSMGRTWGEAAVWTSDANSKHTSQRFADPYTFTHIVHGFVFYWLLHTVPVSASTKFTLATSLEMAWEVLENTPMVIQRYRSETASLGYEGDSILNSVGDIVAMVFGYGLAASLPWSVSLGIVLVLEGGMALVHRDNTILSMMQLVMPSQRIRQWQLDGLRL